MHVHHQRLWKGKFPVRKECAQSKVYILKIIFSRINHGRCCLPQSHTFWKFKYKLESNLMFSFNRIERLWRDVWMSVSNVHYEILHSLEDEGLLDPSDSIHLFCAQHVFLPRLQRDLDVFRDNHPLRTEQNLSPQQLWTMGLLQNLIDAPDLAEVLIKCF